MSEPRWIRFEEMRSPYPKTRFWHVISKEGDGLLGHVSWYGPWRCYSFSPTLDFETVFEHRCLRDIADFCERQTREHLAAAKARRAQHALPAAGLLLLLLASPALAQEAAPSPAPPCDPSVRACLTTESWALGVRVSSPGVEPRDMIGGRWQGELRSRRWRAAGRLDALGLPGQYKTGEVQTARTVEAHLAGAWDAARLPGGVTLGPAVGIGAAVALDDQAGARPRMPQRMTAGIGARASWPRGWVWAVAGCHQATRGVAAVVVYEVRVSGTMATVGAFAVGSRSWVATTGVAVRLR